MKYTLLLLFVSYHSSHIPHDPRESGVKVTAFRSSIIGVFRSFITEGLFTRSKQFILYIRKYVQKLRQTVGQNIHLDRPAGM